MERRPGAVRRNAAEFLEHVRWAAENRAEVRERAQAAREFVLNTRTIDHTIGLWRRAVGADAPSVSQPARDVEYIGTGTRVV